MTDAPAAAQPRVLVVDDEEDLRLIMDRMLQRRGFTVTAAGDAEQALAACREQPVDVLITDLTLPTASGGDLARAAAGLCPGLRVVFISGLPQDIAVDKGLVEPGALLVKKPFTADALAAAVRTVLAGEAAPTS